MNITNTVWRNCHYHPDLTAVLYNGQRVTYKALRMTSELACVRLAAAGVKRGDVVGLTIQNSLAFLIVTLSLARMGAVSTPLGLELSKSEREAMISVRDVRWIVLDGGDLWKDGPLPSSRFIDVGLLLARPDEGEILTGTPPVIQDLDDEPWLIASSSGTTGRPKSNPQKHFRSSLLACLSARANRDDEDLVLVLASLGTEHALYAVMRQLYRGKATMLIQPGSPENFFTAVSRDKPTRVTTTVGTALILATQAVKMAPESLQLCSSIRSVLISGGVVTPHLRRDITKHICPVLEVGYGSTETGSLAISTPETYALNPGATGRLNAWVYGEAVDDNDQPLPAGTPGILRFRSLTATRSYLSDDYKTAQTFRNGWFYPGDTGSVSAAGDLFLSGRIDHMLNVGGFKLDPRRIERLLDDQPAIVESVVVSAVDPNTGGSLLIAIVEAREEFDQAVLKQLCVEHLGDSYAPSAILRIDRLPRNQNGKVMRTELAAQITFRNKEPDV